MDVGSPPNVFLFEDFRFDRGAGALYRAGKADSWQAVAVGSRALDILGILIERRREIVAKDEIFRAVWGGASMEESNLTVQIAALRRALDAGRTGQSCIRTIVGRGYRFLPEVRCDPAPAPAAMSSGVSGIADSSVPSPPGRHVRRFPVRSALILVFVIVASLGAAAAQTAWTAVRSRTQEPVPARLSLVVLPFQNLGGDPGDDDLIKGMTDDLTTDLSHVPQAVVVASATALTYKGRAVDLRVIGADLGVRYILAGSVRRIGGSLRVNAWLIDARSGAHVWSDRFDESIADLARGQDAILARLRVALGPSLVGMDAARGPMREAGKGGSMTDGGQQRLRRVMAALAGRASDRPGATTGWGSACLDARKQAHEWAGLSHSCAGSLCSRSALHIVPPPAPDDRVLTAPPTSFDYRNAFGARGGLEAWELAGLPETPATAGAR